MWSDVSAIPSPSTSATVDEHRDASDASPPVLVDDRGTDAPLHQPVPTPSHASNTQTYLHVDTGVQAGGFTDSLSTGE